MSWEMRICVPEPVVNEIFSKRFFTSNSLDRRCVQFASGMTQSDSRRSQLGTADSNGSRNCAWVTPDSTSHNRTVIRILFNRRKHLPIAILPHSFLARRQLDKFANFRSVTASGINGWRHPGMGIRFSGYLDFVRRRYDPAASNGWRLRCVLLTRENLIQNLNVEAKRRGFLARVFEAGVLYTFFAESLAFISFYRLIPDQSVGFWPHWRK